MIHQMVQAPDRDTTTATLSLGTTHSSNLTASGVIPASWQQEVSKTVNASDWLKTRLALEILVDPTSAPSRTPDRSVGRAQYLAVCGKHEVQVHPRCTQPPHPLYGFTLETVWHNALRNVPTDTAHNSLFSTKHQSLSYIVQPHRHVT